MQVRLFSHHQIHANFLMCLLSAVTAGLGVGAYELFKGRPIGVLASASALNSGLVAATFFSAFTLCVISFLHLTSRSLQVSVNTQLARYWFQVYLGNNTKLAEERWSLGPHTMQLSQPYPGPT